MKRLSTVLLCLLFFVGGSGNIFAQDKGPTNIFGEIPADVQTDQFDAMVKTITMNAIIELMSPEEILTMAWDNQLSNKGLSNDEITISALATMIRSPRVTDYVVEKAVNDLHVPNELLQLAKEEAKSQDNIIQAPKSLVPPQ